MANNPRQYSEGALTRRHALIGTGAALTVAGCGPGDSLTPAAGDKRLTAAGPGPNHGKPAYSPGSAHARPGVTFDPRFGCAVYMRFRKPGAFANGKTMTIRQAYFDIPAGAQPDAIQLLAEAELDQASRSATGWRRNDNAQGRRRRDADFDRFLFGGQQIIFLLVDNDYIAFDDRPFSEDVAVKPNLVRFTRFLAEADSATIGFREAAENNAFFGAALLDGKSFGRGRKLLKLENWYTDSSGNLITGTPELRYSMNIHLLVSTNDGKRIPLVIDPDTGNGFGVPPP